MLRYHQLPCVKASPPKPLLEPPQHGRSHSAHACYSFHTVTDTGKQLHSEQGHADHTPCYALYVLRFVNPKKFHNCGIHLGPTRIKVRTALSAQPESEPTTGQCFLHLHLHMRSLWFLPLDTSPGKHSWLRSAPKSGLQL